MKLLECTFTGVKDSPEQYNSYERYNLNGNSYIKRITKSSETFIEDPNGNYRFILDNNIKLKRVKDNRNLTCKKYGSSRPMYSHIRDEYWDFEDSRYNRNPRVWYLDIETTAKRPINAEAALEEIVLIQIFDSILKTNIILGLEDFEVCEDPGTSFYRFNNKTYDFKVKYLKCDSEAHLLEMFDRLMKQLKPLIVYAHNGRNFDFLYLYHRSKPYGILNKLNCWNFESKLQKNRNGYWELISPGMFFVDFIDLYKRFVFEPRESYSLDYLAKKELNYGKVPHNCFRTFDGFRTGETYIPPEDPEKIDNDFEKYLYEAYSKNDTISFKKITKDWFIHYGIIDTYLLYKLDEKLKLTDLLINVSSLMGVNYDDAMGTTKPWSQGLANIALRNNEVIPDLDPDQRDVQIQVKGGFVKDPYLQKIDYGFSLDVNSMYPLLGMYSFNLSPDTYIPEHKIPKELKEFKDKYLYDEDEERVLKLYREQPEIFKEYTKLLKKYNLCGSIVGAFFDRSKKGIIPRTVIKIYENRKNAKKEMLKYQGEAEKIKEILLSRNVDIDKL